MQEYDPRTVVPTHRPPTGGTHVSEGQTVPLRTHVGGHAFSVGSRRRHKKHRHHRHPSSRSTTTTTTTSSSGEEDGDGDEGLDPALNSPEKLQAHDAVLVQILVVQQQLLRATRTLVALVAVMVLLLVILLIVANKKGEEFDETKTLADHLLQMATDSLEFVTASILQPAATLMAPADKLIESAQLGVNAMDNMTMALRDFVARLNP